MTAGGVEEKNSFGIKSSKGGPMPAGSLVRSRFRRQHFATVIGAEKKKGSLVQRRHRDDLDRKALWRRHVFNENVFRPQPQNAGFSSHVAITGGQ